MPQDSDYEIEGQSAADSGDVNTESGFNAALARAAGKEPAAPAEGERSAPVRPDEDSASDIRAGLGLLESSEISIEAGITVGKTPPKLTREQVMADFEELDSTKWYREYQARPEVQAQRTSQATEAEAGRAAQVTLSVRNLEDAIEADDPEAQLAAARALLEQDPSAYERWVESKSELWMQQADEYGLDDDEEDPAYAFDAQVRLAQTEQQLAETRMALAAQEQQGVQARADGTVAAVQLWAANQGLDLNEAAPFLNAMIQKDLQLQANVIHGIPPTNEIEAEIAQGGPIFNLDPKGMHERLKLLDGLLEEERSVWETAVFQEGVMSQQTTSVAEGIETSTDRLTKALEANAPKALRGIDPERVRARVRGQRATRVGDLRRAMAAPSKTDVSRGLTDGSGKPISVDQATGALERFEEEQRAAKARDKGLGR